EQEAALRAVVDGGPPPPGATADLRSLLARYGSPEVTVSTPATPLVLPAAVAQGACAAVGAALDNVRAHCGSGARAWVLAESGDGTVTVSVRDDGPGIPDGRLEEAVADGRMGVARSIRGRVAELGGRVSIVSVPGQGTEVEITLPA
ncbi:sensor histidine kinase, partial [Nonomuraea insulae]